MIREITLAQEHYSLVKQTWSNIPGLAVIAGFNGAGKSQLLTLMNQSLQSAQSRKLLQTPQQAVVQGKVKYIPPGFKPGDIYNSNNAQDRQKPEQRRANLLAQVRNSKAAVPANLQGLFAEIRSSVGKDIITLDDDEFLDALPVNLKLRMEDSFKNDYIVEIFSDYQGRVARYKIKNYGMPNSKLDEEIYESLGIDPPWLTINNLFQKYGFSYQINEPVDGISYVPQFIDLEDPSLRVSFSGLSSGEQIIVTLVLWTYNANQSEFTKVFLFDEFDAHLNPSLSHMMMEMIKEKIVEEFGIQVIMTTHSPSTVACTDEQNLFWLDRKKPIRPVTHKEIIPILSDGIITISHNNALQILGQVVGVSDKPILCVEGITDKEILECAWMKLFTHEMPFQIHDFFDCHSLVNLFLRGNIFTNYPSHQFFGLVDFDDAYSVMREKFEKKSGWSKEIGVTDKSVTFKKSDMKGVITTLDVPDFRNNLAGHDVRGSMLSIELLFRDEIVSSYCTQIQTVGGASVPRFDDKKKTQFSRKVSELDAPSFDQFKPLLKRIESYVEHQDSD